MRNGSSIRVFVVAESDGEARKLAALLSPSIGLAITGCAASTHLLQLDPALDVVVARNPSSTAVQAIAQLKVPVLWLMLAKSSGTPSLNGASAVLPPHAPPAQIMAAIAAIAAGLHVHAAEPSARAIPEDMATPRSSDTEDPGIAFQEALTERELEVLNLLADGLSNPMIAKRLGVSRNTVKFHVSSILAKLGANSRTEAVTLGLRRGLVIL